ncbi:hypothetical protein CEXT_425941 [Caerostris extrusa]|uniref:Uncharacterized protein n=1 Tax=Caerostris extrusa TaxID=172846 RepID=A0AAV4NU72_CAEEX|nr:hypothetical protein CEXT_425941 [Caerostris extrusa]
MVENLKAKFSFATCTLKESECRTERKKVASICATGSKVKILIEIGGKKVLFLSFLRPDEMKRVVTKRSLWVLRLEIEVTCPTKRDTLNSEEQTNKGWIHGQLNV